MYNNFKLKYIVPTYVLFTNYKILILGVLLYIYIFKTIFMRTNTNQIIN